MTTILQGKNVNKSFGGLSVLSELDFAFNEGETIGLIGPNGAGKTTLINIITGIIKISSGTFLFQGEDITGMKPYNISKIGIARTFQVSKPFRGMTVKENVLVGAFFGKNGMKRSRSQAHMKADEAISFMGMEDKRDKIVNDITLLDLKQMDLAKAVAMEPELLLLDEVMAGLNPTEVSEMSKLLVKLKQSVSTILIIEHVMSVIHNLCERVMVLHHGNLIAEGPPTVVLKSKEVIRAYLGNRFADNEKGN